MDSKAVLEKMGVDVNFVDGENLQTALHHACMEDSQVDIAHLLIGVADIHAYNKYGWTPLHFASCRSAIFDGVVDKLFRTYRNDPNIVSRKGYCTLLMACAMCNKPDRCLMYLQHGAVVDEKDRSGKTALHFAENLNVYTVLLDYGADPNVQDCTGYTPLHRMLRYEKMNQDRLKCVKLLLMRGANVNTALWINRMTPLMTSSMKGHIQVIRLLLEKGATVDAKDSDGLTALHHAGESVRAKDMRYLRKKDAFQKEQKLRVARLLILIGKADVHVPPVLHEHYHDIVKQRDLKHVLQIAAHHKIPSAVTNYMWSFF